MKKFVFSFVCAFVLSGLTMAQCDPVPQVMGMSGGKVASMSAADLAGLNQVDIKMGAECADGSWEVVSFDVTIIDNAVPTSFSSDGKTLNDQQKKLLKKAKAGQQIYIERIVAANDSGQRKELGSITFLLD